jgi:hypothetical protein
MFRTVVSEVPRGRAKLTHPEDSVWCPEMERGNSGAVAAV